MGEGGRMEGGKEGRRRGEGKEGRRSGGNPSNLEGLGGRV